MPTEVNKEIELEIAYVLFIDIAGYSKLVTHEQRRLLELLNRIVREAEHFRMAEANGRLITVPTGDGMALVFYNTLDAPVECALEIGRAACPERTPWPLAAFYPKVDRAVGSAFVAKPVGVGVAFQRLIATQFGEA
jgi:class 3 adenylate cyclase